MVDEEGIDVTAVMGSKKKRKADGDDAADGEAAAAKPPKVRHTVVCLSEALGVAVAECCCSTHDKRDRLHILTCACAAAAKPPKARHTVVCQSIRCSSML
jgi:hypothetical protein